MSRDRLTRQLTRYWRNSDILMMSLEPVERPFTSEALSLPRNMRTSLLFCAAYVLRNRSKYRAIPGMSSESITACRIATELDFTQRGSSSSMDKHGPSVTLSVAAAFDDWTVSETNSSTHSMHVISLSSAE